MSTKGTLINDNEYQSLYGLPHIQQLLYLRGIRPYMDYQTGIVGIKRKISYQSLSEEIYVEPHTGYCGKKYSRPQLRRALEGLVRAGLLSRQSRDMQLIFECVLATRDNSAQNKPVTKPAHQPGSKARSVLNSKSSDYDFEISKAIIHETVKAVTPPVSGNYHFILGQEFENFWKLYPLKKSKQKAWEQFCLLQPSQELCIRMRIALVEQTDFEAYQRSNGKWTPPWKYPANWLAQRAWEDELNTKDEKEKDNAICTRNHDRKSVDPFWESCQAGSESCDSEPNNVIQFSRHREPANTD